ncbi:hypothetical protein V494_02583 [Pseudogymnoascus sp. VKM F-4513 (FW-928)]|nr:hypothetical protein V494_02583 [Pseudogymnoascus sp. VKM F-4513 (FW-928)]
MDYPMQDSCAALAKDGAEETQYVSVEIDTQATDGYDDALLASEASKKIADITPRAPSTSKPGPWYTVPPEQDEPAVTFTFAKPAHKTPIFKPIKPGADATTAPPPSNLNSFPEICNSTQEQSHSSNSTNEVFPSGGDKAPSEPAIGDEEELVAGIGTGQRPALRQKDPNVRRSTNIPTKQQKRGVSFASGLINNDRQSIQSLMPQKTQFTSTPLPFAGIQPQAKKRRTTPIPRTLQQQSLVSMQKESRPDRPSSAQSGSLSSLFEDQTPVQNEVLQLKQEAPLRADVDDDLDAGQVSEQYFQFPGHLPPTGPLLNTRAHSPTASSSGGYEPLSSHIPAKSAAKKTRRATVYPKVNDRIRKLSATNMPFPDVTYPAHPHPDNGQSTPEIDRRTQANKSGIGHKKNVQARTNSECSVEGIDVRDWADGGGYAIQRRESASYSGETSNFSTELHQSIEAYLEKGKQSLLEQIQEKDAKINEVSKKNKDYAENINELTRTNASLCEGLSTMREKANALSESVKLQLEECKSLGEFVIKHKAETAELRQEVENMKTSLQEARNGLEGLELHQQNSKASLKEATLLAKSQIKSSESLQQKLEMYQVQVQQERDKSKLLQKELQAQHQEKRLKEIVKDLLDSHCLSITDKLIIHEGKLSEAIGNAERENQNRLSECLKLLESATEKSPQTPKEVLEMKSLIETLSTSISDRLQSADDGAEDLRNAGTEVMEALKARVETLFEVQDAQKGLEERISTLQVANARLEVATRGYKERVLHLQTQLTAKESEIERCRAESNQKSEWNQTQFDNEQKELEKCRKQLATRDDELQKARAMVEAGSVAQIELTILQETHAKAVDDLEEATKNLTDCQATLAKQDKVVSTIQAQNTDLQERLSFAQQKAIDVGRELSRFKASANESLKRQRAEAETHREKSVESERRSHVQKVSNLQRLRGEAEAMVKELKAEIAKTKEDVEKKEQAILALKTEKSTLEDENKKQAERLAHPDQGSISQLAELRSLAEDLKSNGLNISQVKAELARNEESSAAASQIHQALISEHTAVKSRLEAYERVEAKVEEYCQKSGKSFEGDAADAILQILASFENLTGVFPGTTLQENSAENGTARSRTRNGQATSSTNTITRRQAPNSPEILDSQMPSAPSSSPLPRQGVRSIAQQRGAVPSKATLHPQGSPEETEFREPRTTKDPKDGHSDSPFFRLEIEDSQDKRHKSARSPSYSSLTELDSDDFDQIGDCLEVSSNHPEDKKGSGEATARGQRPAEVADLKPPKARLHRPAAKLQAKMPLKGCLKKTAPRNDLVDDNTLPSDAVEATPLHLTSMGPYTRPQASKARLASIPKVHDQSKKLFPDNNIIRGGITPRLDSQQSTPMQSESSASRPNARKRTIASIANGVEHEVLAKQPRLSIPGREFQAVGPFVPEARKTRASTRQSL